MLVIGRKEGDSLILEVPPSTEGFIIKVALVEVRKPHHQSRIGVEADIRVKVHRAEKGGASAKAD